MLLIIWSVFVIHVYKYYKMYIFCFTKILIGDFILNCKCINFTRNM